MAEDEINPDSPIGGADHVSPEVGESRPPRAKSQRGGWLFVLAALVVIAIVLIRAGSQKIDWIDDYQRGVELAQQQGKPMLLAFEQSGCPSCVKMKQYTYANQGIAKFISKRFIAVSLDTDKNTQLAERYNVSVIPYIVVTWPDSDKFATVVGYVTAGELGGRLSRALEKAEPSSR